MKKIPLLFLALLLVTFTHAQHVKVNEKYANTRQKLDTQKVLQTIAFGSCNHQDKPQVMWKEVVKNKPDLWIWLGDIIYADTEDMQVMAKMYSFVKNNIDYRRLLACAPVIGIWDDHDYGVNDGGKNYPMKDESKRLMFEFLDVPPNAASRKHEAAYQSFTFGKEGQKIKIILLDARYYRDDMVKSPDPNKRYEINENGDILGEVQWAWLEKELANSDAQINLIGNGTQVIPTQQGYEKWANYPKARKRFFEILQKTKPAMPILLTGDRHMAEISKIELEGLDTPVFEVTSSGITHTWSQKKEDPNRYRVGKMVIEKNFALLKIDWSGVTPKVTVEVRGLGNELFLEEQLF
ncbi:MAG TPA: alkaline phosphatase family protein [Phaeodactylibacter sp.]|nr:alkaline phosphatase family protein [Phaeodactylibacter sp.]